MYQVSNLGRVKSLPRNGTIKKERILKAFPAKYGIAAKYGNGTFYIRVHLSQNDKTKTLFVHRLVAKAFIPNPDNLPEVNHKDENKANNCADNLEWCSTKYNYEYGTGRIRAIKSCSKAVKCIETGIIYQSLHHAERRTGIAHTAIGGVCNHKPKYKTAGGYHWEFL